MSSLMNEPLARTDFAPAARAGAAEVEALRRKVILDRFLPEFLETIPDMVLVLNHERQAIAANRLAQTTLGVLEIPLIGRRPGEILGCVNAATAPGGCGTSASCRLCGVIQAVQASQENGEQVSREARILVGGAQVAAFDLLISAKPATVEGIPLTVCVLRDISDQKRRAILESVFFHDILNTAGGIYGLAGVLAEGRGVQPPEREQEFRQGMFRLSRRLIEEIRHQQDLLAAERGVFVPREEDIAVPALMQEVLELYANHPVARDRFLEIGEGPACTIRSDATIIRKVLGNLVKNALEASPEGSTVRISCRDLGEQVALEVHNPGVIPLEVQMQIFQRSFSTKADSGRGIGTYSIKLFVERYLQGTVGFTSAEPGGTVFRVVLPKAPAAG